MDPFILHSSSDLLEPASVLSLLVWEILGYTPLALQSTDTTAPKSHHKNALIDVFFEVCNPKGPM
jgi:hypothetical protein